MTLLDIFTSAPRRAGAALHRLPPRAGVALLMLAAALTPPGARAADPGAPGAEPPAFAPVNPAPGAQDMMPAASWLTSVERNLSIAVLGFGIVVLLIQFVTLRGITASNPELVIRAYAVTLIVVCTLFLVSAGLSANQIAPGIGLFGTIAGYLLGRAGRSGGEGSDKS